MWWLIGSAPDFWGRSPGFASGIYHNDPNALWNKVEKYHGRDGNLPTPEAKKKMKKKKKKNIFCKNFVGCFSFDFKFVLYSTTYCKQN